MRRDLTVIFEETGRGGRRGWNECEDYTLIIQGVSLLLLLIFLCGDLMLMYGLTVIV